MMKSPRINALVLAILISVLLINLALGGKKNPYDLLGVKKNASDREIKKAFRKLSLQYHPDKNKDPNAEDTFREIAEAYTILSDPEKRKRFDQFGYEDETGHSGSGFSGGQQFHFNMHDFFKNFDDAFQHQGRGHHHHSFEGFNFDDIFDGMDSDEFDFFNSPGGFHSGAVDDFAHGFGAGDSFFGSHMSASSFSFSSSSQGNCRTVTKRSGNTVYTHTECS